MYKARRQLSSIDWNYHKHLPKAKTSSGDEIATRKYNSRTRKWDIKSVKVEKSYGYIPLLISKIISRRLHDTESVTRNVSLNASDPGNIAPTIAPIPAPQTRYPTTEKQIFIKKLEFYKIEQFRCILLTLHSKRDVARKFVLS